MIQISTDMWVTLANPIKAVSDTVREVWVCDNNVLSKVYPSSSPDVYWYLVTNSGRAGAYDFHLCAGQSHVPSTAVSSGKVDAWSGQSARPYHNQRSIILSVVVDEAVNLQHAAYLFQNFTAAETWTGISNISIDPSCTSTNRMFMGCAYLSSLDISSWDMSHVQDMEAMFAGEVTSSLQSNSRLTSLVLPNNFGASATKMGYLFSGLKVLTSLDATKIKTDNATNTRNMFTGCWRLTELDVSTFNTTNVTDMRYMFSNCTDIQTIYASSSFVTTAVTNGTGVFGGNSGCPNLVGGAGTAWNSSNIDYTYAHIDGGSGNPGYFTAR